VGKWDEVQVEVSWVQSYRRREQHSCGMSLFTVRQHVLFSLQGSVAEPCLPLAGPCLSAKGLFDTAVLMPRSISTASVSLLARLNLAHLHAGAFLLSTKVFDTALHMSKFFSSLLVTGLPHGSLNSGPTP
jgi:hypothetical protein